MFFRQVINEFRSSRPLLFKLLTFSLFSFAGSLVWVLLTGDILAIRYFFVIAVVAFFGPELERLLILKSFGLEIEEASAKMRLFARSATLVGALMLIWALFCRCSPIVVWHEISMIFS